MAFGKIFFNFERVNSRRMPPTHTHTRTQNMRTLIFKIFSIPLEELPCFGELNLVSFEKYIIAA